MEMSPAAYASLDPTNLDNFKNPLHVPGDDGLMGVLDASNASAGFTAQKEGVEILPGKRADLLAYHAERDGKSYVNPTIRVQKGKQLSAEFTNDLDEETTVHWHGLHVDWRMDGHPFRPVATYRYAFPVQDRGGTYWYHPHPHGWTSFPSWFKGAQRRSGRSTTMRKACLILCTSTVSSSGSWRGLAPPSKSRTSWWTRKAGW